MVYKKILSTSFDVKYLVRLVSNILNALLSFVSVILITRSLEPELYGNFGFLNNFFIQIFPFFTLNSSLAFYTKLSQRNDNYDLVIFYKWLLIIGFLLILFSVGFVQYFDISRYLWPEQNMKFVYFSLLYAFFSIISNTLVLVADAIGITVKAEFSKVLQKLLGLGIIYYLYVSVGVNLDVLYYFEYTMFFILSATLFVVIPRVDNRLLKGWHLSYPVIKSKFREIYNYSKSLLLYGFISMIVMLGDRWMLQNYSGSAEQGFYEVALKISALSFLFTNAATQLITREFAVSFAAKNFAEMSRLFRKYIPALYSISALFGCFIIVNSNEVTSLFFGDKFINSSITIAIMAFYPIHQTYGQLSGGVFYAMGKTSLYSKIGIFFMVLGLPITYILLVPNFFGDTNLGSIGLAFKTIFLQFFAVNVQLFYNCRTLKMSFMYFLKHQLSVLTLFLALALLSQSVVKMFLTLNSNIFILILSFISYIISVIMITLIYPSIFGIKKQFLLSQNEF